MDNTIVPSAEASEQDQAASTGLRPSRSPAQIGSDPVLEGTPRAKRQKSSGGEGNGAVQLACFSCRNRRVRCSGERPACQACIKAKIDCQWPAGRRRKRTRKEMEDARRSMGATYRTPPQFNAVAGPSTSPRHTFDPSTLFDFSTTPLLSTSTSNPSQSLFTGAGEHTQLPNSTTSIPDLRLLDVLGSQTAYIEGDPARGQDLELFYYRFSGTTAISPGFNRISLKLQRRTQNAPGAPLPETDNNVALPQAINEMFDPTGMPLPEVRTPLFKIFFEHMSQHFPSLSYQRMNERFESGTMSNFLANCICALAARFSNPINGSPTQACVPFIVKAQELFVPLLHLPSSDVITGLIMLAWANYGQNSESGLWQYSGMAYRMAIDLGIHEHSEIYESPAHQMRSRLLFWTLFITDRFLAFSTGRPASLPEDIIEIALPEDSDFFPDPSRNAPEDLPEAIEPVPFVQIVKLMVICGRICNVLNGRRGRPRTLVDEIEPLPEVMAGLQAQLLQFYSGLPESLKWSSDNFKHQHARGHGGSFLSLHVWANAVMALVYHPDLLKSPSGIDTPLTRSMSRSVKLSLASSRQICESMVFADLVSETAYISSPFVVQPLYVAAMALIGEMRSLQAGVGQAQSGSVADMFLTSVAKQNLSALVKAVERIEVFWAGANHVASLLEKRAGLHRPSARPSKKILISLPDHGILRRFTTDREHVAPPTETSLRESIAKSEGSGPGSNSGQLWLSDFLAGYTVENTSLSRLDNFDLARLLGDGFGADIGLAVNNQSE